MDFSKVTSCGENCGCCGKKADGICEGCIESGGNCREWAESKDCPFFRCAAEHEVLFCGLCAEFPCRLLREKLTWNPDFEVGLTKLAAAYRAEMK